MNLTPNKNKSWHAWYAWRPVMDCNTGEWFWLEPMERKWCNVVVYYYRWRYRKVTKPVGPL